MSHLFVWIFCTVLAFALSVGGFCAAISIATSRLEEQDAEPVDPPHRPIWR